jgi:hypothetical protein
MKKQILFIAMAIGLVVPIEAQPTAREQITALCISLLKDVAKDCFLAYAIAKLNTLAHEAGHALASKACHGTYSEIGIGGQRSDPTYVTIPWFNIKLKGFNPLSGYCVTPVSDTTTKDGCLKSMVVGTAGPLFGIVSSLTSFILLNKYADKYILSKLMCCVCATENILNSIPSVAPNDGRRVYEAYKKYRSYREALETQKSP